MANAVRQTQTGSLRRYVTTLSLPEWLTANPALAQAITRASSDYNAARVALAGLLAAFDPLADDLARGGVDPKTVGDAGLVARRADAIAAWQNLSQAVADAYDALAAMIGRPDLMADGRAPPPDLEVSLLAGASGFAEALFVDSPEPLPWPRLWEGVHLKRAGFASRLVGTTVLWSRDGTRAFVLPSRGVRGTYQPEFRFSGTPGPELPAITRGDTPVVEVVQLGLVRLGAA
jgi:hypothetical protein